MSFRHLALLALLAAPLSAWAIQPVEVGLQPLYKRMAEIQDRQFALIRTLEAVSASPASKTHAYRNYQALVSERCRIDEEIAQAMGMERSGLVNYMTKADTSSTDFSPAQK